MAAEEVRKTVKAFRIASRAKIAAETAAKNAHDTYHSENFSTPEEEEAAQTRVSSTQSDAIHAAVIEHEALSAKRKAAIALARDVRYWNIHRKREILSTSIEAAKAQQRAAIETTKAWTQLRDGLLDLSAIPLLVRNKSHEEPIDSKPVQRKGFEKNCTDDNAPLIISSEPYSQGDAFEETTDDRIVVEQENIASVHSEVPDKTSDVDALYTHQHVRLPDSTLLEELSSHSYLDTSQSLFNEIENQILQGDNDRNNAFETKTINEGGSTSGVSVSKKENDWSEDFDALLSDPDDDEIVEKGNLSNKKVSDDDDNELNSDQASQSSSFHDAVEGGAGLSLEDGISAEPTQELSKKEYFDASEHSSLLVEKSNLEKSSLESTERDNLPDESPTSEIGRDNDQDGIESSQDKDTGNDAMLETNHTEQDKESMTDSMQSLVDGLMTWGGQWDSDDDVSLPFGMAASLAIEEKKRQDLKRVLLKKD